MYTPDQTGAVMKFKFLLLALLGLALSGCSATTLRCGITSDGESYVDLVNVPQDISVQTRSFTELCGFAYEKDEV